MSSLKWPESPLLCKFDFHNKGDSGHKRPVFPIGFHIKLYFVRRSEGEALRPGSPQPRAPGRSATCGAVACPTTRRLIVGDTTCVA